LAGKGVINILFLYGGIIDPIRGGIERVTSVLASYFEAKGHKAYFLGLKSTGSTEDDRQYYLPDSAVRAPLETMILQYVSNFFYYTV
jgi:hypothetical protein